MTETDSEHIECFTLDIRHREEKRQQREMKSKY